MVMLASERRDVIEISGVERRFEEDIDIPDALSVVERRAKYYGPELLVHAKLNGVDHNYLLTAPGPDSYLILWAAETDEENFRENWRVLAEVRATLAVDQPSYEICPDCGKPMKSIEHEQKAALGMCGD